MTKAPWGEGFLNDSSEQADSRSWGLLSACNVDTGRHFLSPSGSPVWCQQHASITWCDLFRPKFARTYFCTWRLGASKTSTFGITWCDTISSQICVSKFQRFFALGDGCWLTVWWVFGVWWALTGQRVHAQKAFHLWHAWCKCMEPLRHLEKPIPQLISKSWEKTPYRSLRALRARSVPGVSESVSKNRGVPGSVWGSALGALLKVT